MKRILELSIFQLLSEYTQHKASVAEFASTLKSLNSKALVAQASCIIVHLYPKSLAALTVILG